MARPLPMLPLVRSITVSPFLMSPAFSASTIIRSAARSFTLKPGLADSSLTRTRQPVPAARRLSATQGVSPISSSTFSHTEGFRILNDFLSGRPNLRPVEIESREGCGHQAVAAEVDAGSRHIEQRVDSEHDHN